MNTPSVWLFLVFLALPQFGLAEMAYLTQGPKVIPSQYIVTLNPGVRPFVHLAKLHHFISTQPDAASQHILHEYTIGTFVGYAIRCSEATLSFLLQDERDVYLVEADGLVATAGIQQDPPSWGLDRVSQRSLPLDKSFEYPDSAGEGVDMYTIDTGIYVEHEDFEDRATWGFNAIAGSADRDGNGHGTHCSGTMAGALHGVAKRANLYAVKVLNDWGSGTWSDVIAGIEWVAMQHKPGKKSVANMSLGGGFVQAVNSACNAAVEQGVHLAVAAGNNAGDACNSSPSSAELVVTVGATDIADKMASFSNFGPCVEIFAPGVSITSAWIGTPRATNTISGTSMASPHVAGVMALYLAEGVEPTIEILQGEATEDIIMNIPTNTVNLFVYSDEKGPSNITSTHS